MAKTRVLLLAGGQSHEHEISILSAQSMLKACADSAAIELIPQVIAKTGGWLSPEESRRALMAGGTATGGSSMLQAVGVAENYDIVFPLLHGPNGEDGTIQGMLEMAGIPYVGSGVLASALCMDKAMSKDIFAQHGLPQTRYSLVRQSMWDASPERVLQHCREMTSPDGPWFVKPANLGSSLGITRATDEAALRSGIALALTHDRRVVVEQAVRQARELEVGVLGNDNPKASVVGEITYKSAFYDYETKYTDGRAELIIPAHLPDTVAQRLRQVAVEAFLAADCAGFARVDFLYAPETEETFLSEINTIPGFTPYSMITKLFGQDGLDYVGLVERLVALGLERQAPQTAPLQAVR